MVTKKENNVYTALEPIEKKQCEFSNVKDDNKNFYLLIITTISEETVFNVLVK